MYITSTLLYFVHLHIYALNAVGARGNIDFTFQSDLKLQCNLRLVHTNTYTIHNTTSKFSRLQHRLMHYII